MNRSRPLDFLIVTDHFVTMGLFPDLMTGQPELLAKPGNQGDQPYHLDVNAEQYTSGS